MPLPLFLHIFFIGLWIGCVMVETILENSRFARELAPPLHDIIDRWVEVPAFSMVLISGLWMLDIHRMSGLYALKVTCGLIAVGMNIYCFPLVLRRKRAADKGDKELVKKYSRQIFFTAIIGFPAALIALGIGLHLLGIY